MMKLERYGISEFILNWIKSFLSNRKQLMSVNGAKLSLDPVISGIPQESVLGSLLFVIYINDLPEHDLSTIFLFADDTKIIKEINSILDSLIIQSDIEALERWSREWLLKFHPTNAMF